MLRIAVVAGLYVVGAKIGLSFGFRRGNVTAVWPPAGIAVAALYLYGWRLWPGVALGALLLNGLGPTPLGVACAMAAGSTAGATIGARLLRLLPGFHPSLSRVRDVAGLTAVAMVCAAVAAAVCSSSLWLGGLISTSALATTARVWWAGDALGTLIVGGAILTVLGSAPRVSIRNLAKATALLPLLAVVMLFSIAATGGFTFLLVPTIIWVAMWFGPRGAALATIIGVGVTAVATARGQGPFVTDSGIEPLWRLDAFLAVVAVTGLVVAAVVSERNNVQAELRAANRDLEDKVGARTTELDRDRADLAEAQSVAHLGSFRIDVAGGGVAYWSDELFRICGLDKATFKPSLGALLSRLHPDDRIRIQTVIAGAVVDGSSFDVEGRMVRPDGEVRVFASSGRVIRDENGGALSISGICQDITDRKGAEDALSHRATHDVLTDLPNRTLLLSRLSDALQRGAVDGRPTAVFFLDIDRFKWLNDSLGHAAGDELLIEVARRLRNCVRPDDIVARQGGDEFVIVCEDLDRTGAMAMAERLAVLIAEPVDIGAAEVTPTVSIGIAESDPQSTADALLRDADAAMYKAKEHGRARFELFDARMRAGAEARLETEAAIRRGLDHGEFLAHFQPVVDLATGRAVGVEALARWQHPTEGLLSPDRFIPLAEETGLIVALGTSVLRASCAQVAAWRLLPELADLQLSVNLSARQLLASDLPAVVSAALEDSGLPAEALCLEITESVLLEDGEAASAVMAMLKSLGVRIGVDDFGTGFSSLTYLKRFPVDVLKIDRSFVLGLGTSREDRAIVAGIVDLAHAFGITTISEGVESVAQFSELVALGCEQAQGYLWSKPLDGTEALACMRSMAAASISEPVDTDASQVRILVVEDDASMRGLLAAIFSGEAGYDLVGAAADGREAVAIARRRQPDVVLLDLAMPGIGGLEALPLIRAVAPAATVVVLSGLESAGMEDRARSAGASAYLTKTADPTLLPHHLTTLLAS